MYLIYPYSPGDTEDINIIDDTPFVFPCCKINDPFVEVASVHFVS
jgi:hypothetical protein